MPSQLPTSFREKKTLTNNIENVEQNIIHIQQKDDNVKNNDCFTELHQSDGDENTQQTKSPNNKSNNNINEQDKSEDDEEKQQPKPEKYQLKKSIFSNDDFESTTMYSPVLKSSTRKKNRKTTFTKNVKNKKLPMH